MTPQRREQLLKVLGQIQSKATDQAVGALAGIVKEMIEDKGNGITAADFLGDILGKR